MLASLDSLLPKFASALTRSHRQIRELSERAQMLDARVTALQGANRSLERRVRDLDASLHVTQAMATVYERGGLLNRAAEAISEHFGFYHVGIYLMDELEEWAVLEAASSVAGKEMVLEGHRLPRGHQSIVGWVAEHRRPRWADYPPYNNAGSGGSESEPGARPHLADLPATRSALALPLLLGDQLMGILDLHSTEEGAFQSEASFGIGDPDQLREASWSALEGRRMCGLGHPQSAPSDDEAAVLRLRAPSIGQRVTWRLPRQRKKSTALSSSAAGLRPARVLIARTKGRYRAHRRPDWRNWPSD